MSREEGKKRRKLGSLGFLFEMVRLNLLSGMAYRASFMAQIVFMMLNNAMFLVFWWIFFSRFGEVQGWKLNDVTLLFGIGASGFGLSVVFFGNILRLSSMIRDGQIDYYLLLPPDPLVHILMSKMVFSGLGDIVFGFLIFFLGTSPDLPSLALFTLLSFLSGIVFTSFCAIVHSLTFFAGNTEGISRFLSEALLTFSLYPENLFRGTVRAMLFSIVPAGFVSYLPVQLLREFDGGKFAAMVAATAGFAFLAAIIFRMGLRRYESGNLIAPRS